MLLILTALALAIELTASKKVLLFVGDAQVGEWLSWYDVKWLNAEAQGGACITCSDLIQRTVLYKVGHHVSHSATPRETGLEMMKRGDLVAMIPVDEDQARCKKWPMPFEPLLLQLVEKTQGRIIRAERGLPVKLKGMLQA